MCTREPVRMCYRWILSHSKLILEYFNHVVYFFVIPTSSSFTVTVTVSCLIDFTVTYIRISLLKLNYKCFLCL